MESDNIEIYYDEEVDTHFIEFVEATSKDAGTYKATHNQTDLMACLELVAV
jgi:hypothetical protein